MLRRMVAGVMIQQSVDLPGGWCGTLFVLILSYTEGKLPARRAESVREQPHLSVPSTKSEFKCHDLTDVRLRHMPPEDMGGYLRCSLGCAHGRQIPRPSTSQSSSISVSQTKIRNTYEAYAASFQISPALKMIAAGITYLNTSNLDQPCQTLPSTSTSSSDNRKLTDRGPSLL